jgi:F420H(2)-dependent quinone reductase
MANSTPAPEIVADRASGDVPRRCRSTTYPARSIALELRSRQKGFTVSSLFHNVLRAHQWIYQSTDGFLGHRLLWGIPTLLLYTTGRRTGRRRTSALLYGRDGDTYLVVASKGGDPKPPGWLVNLDANPDCEFQIGRDRYRATARITRPDDPDYSRRWALMDRLNRGRYTEYQNKTDRRIPIVELHSIH